MLLDLVLLSVGLVLLLFGGQALIDGATGLARRLGVSPMIIGLTAVASNTASAAVLIPLAIPLASVLGLDPVLLVAVVAIASSCDFALVIGTPPTMIAYSTGLFRASDILRTGLALDLIGVVVLLTAVVGVWRLLGVF